MDLSKLKWLKNVRPDQGWAYDKLNEMPIPEAKIFRLHWRTQDCKANAQQTPKGDLIALVQLARVTHTGQTHTFLNTLGIAQSRSTQR